jgi:aryl carrier-like protein
MGATCLTEEEFIGRAKAFLHDIGGVDSASLDPDADLVEAGILDSLLLIAFFAFVEELRGHELEVRPEDLQAVSTLRSAYTLARTDAPDGRGHRGP